MTVQDLEQKQGPDEALRFLRVRLNNYNESCTGRPRLLSSLAVLEMRAGLMDRAIAAGRSSLESANLESKMSSADIALTRYLLATALMKSGAGLSAIPQYERALQFFEQPEHADSKMRARINSDLAVVNLQAGLTESAKAYIDKAVAIQAAGSQVVPGERIRVLDVLAHVQFDGGRLTDGLRTSRRALAIATENAGITDDIQSHLSRDVGEFLSTAQNYEESLVYLSRAAAIEGKAPGRPGYALTLVTTAHVHNALGHFEMAGRMLSAAVQHMQALSAACPLEASYVFAAQGSYLYERKQWSLSRDRLLDALRILDTLQSSPALRVDCLLKIAEDDHHLKRKQEERSFRRQYKDAVKVINAEPARGDTVDVLTLLRRER